MRKNAAVSPAESLSDEVRRDLIESVFADTQTMVLGAFMTIVNGLVIARFTHSWMAVGASAMIALVVVSRIRLKWIYNSRARGSALTDVRWLERHYVAGMIAYLLAVGLLAVAAFAASDDAFVLTLAVSSAVTHAIGIAVRNFAIRTGVGLQLSAVAIPLGAAFVAKGATFPLLVPLLLVPLCFFIYGSASRLRNILLSQIAFRAESELIANQFDFATNNMSHGMCVVSAEKRILVSNAKFSEFLALERTRPLTNIQLEVVTRLAKRRGAVPQEAIDELLRAFDAVSVAGLSQSLEFETGNQSSYEVTITPNSRGGWVVVVQDVTAKRNADRQIDRMAHFDSVTNLRNRRSFELILAKLSPPLTPAAARD